MHPEYAIDISKRIAEEVAKCRISGREDHGQLLNRIDKLEEVSGQVKDKNRLLKDENKRLRGDIKMLKDENRILKDDNKGITEILKKVRSPTGTPS